MTNRHDITPDNDDYDIRSEAIRSDQDFERALRPGRFESFAGQERIVENLRVFAAKPSTTCCSTAPPAWARPPSRLSLPTSWEWASR